VTAAAAASRSQLDTAHSSLLWRLLRFALFVPILYLLVEFVSLDLSWPRQAIFGLLLVLLIIWMDRSSDSYLITLTLMFVSIAATSRYAWWRFHTVFNFFADPTTPWHSLDAFFILVLLMAEGYAFLILFLGYLQTVWPLRRAPVPLPDNPLEWPEVDVIVPTYNEPLSVVRYTALAAAAMDYPPAKCHVYILDDGHRDDFRAFAQEAGIGYITRSDNKHAKAGNINHALKQLKSPFVAIFDCDHVPTRSFLQVTMGWFLRDCDLGMLQTPHHFYSPDPFERNLEQFRVIPNEGELFYGIVQDGNDFWNAAFFCGSCAVLRREALDEIGGIATDTVTEDAHTSLRIQMRGWNTAYINIPQAAGLATERLSGHVKQRIRWARGMSQILRVDNPLLARGLEWPQRLCYFNAMMHFMYGLPRLIFLGAPLIYMLLGHTNIPGYWAAILAYALPHLVLCNVTNSRIQGHHRHSFWNEIYETVLAPYIMLPTFLALINPKLGKFNVTDKGGVVDNSYFDGAIARPFVVLLVLNMMGALAAIPRLYHVPLLGALNDSRHAGTVYMNLFWIVFNIVVLGVATAVAHEAQQRRTTVRIRTTIPAIVRLADGTQIAGETEDISAGGVAIRLLETADIQLDERMRVSFPLRAGDASLPSSVTRVDGKVLRLKFDAMTLPEQETLTMVLYSQADAWLGWGESREADQPLRSLWRICKLSSTGLAQAVRGVLPGGGKRRGSALPAMRAAAGAFVLACVLLGASTLFGQAAKPRPDTRADLAKIDLAKTDLAGTELAKTNLAKTNLAKASLLKTPLHAVGSFHQNFTLTDLGVPAPIELRGIDSYYSIYFALPETQVVRQATMTLSLHFSPSLIPNLSHLKVMVNGTLVTTIEATQVNPVVPITIPADLLVRNNELTFEFIGHYTLACEDPAHTSLWMRIDRSSIIDLSGDLLPLQDDLKRLPLPFYDDALQTPPVLPFVFFAEPSPRALQAAGIVASWFGVQANARPIKFPVSIGSMPQGNVIVLAESSSQLPAELKVAGGSGPTISMHANPGDPYGKVLIISGDDADQLIQAAQAFSSQKGLLEGKSVHVDETRMPAPRLADDAPRWLSTNSRTPESFWDNSNMEQLQGGGAVTLPVYLRLPPDLYYGERSDLTMQLNYAYNAIPLANQSSLKIRMNGAFIGNLPLKTGDQPRTIMNREVALPVVDLRPFSNTFLFDYFFQIQKQGECKNNAPTNLYGSILRSSSIDIRGLPHWAAMPNLELFANAGFPFTRLADLADTKVVMPSTASPDELTLFLDLMGHFGAMSGYPTLRVSVVEPDGLVPGDSNYLVLGTIADQPAIQKLNASLPVTVDADGIKVKDTGGFFALTRRAWWRMHSERSDDGQMVSVGGAPDAIIEGIESPWSANQSIVMIALRDSDAAEAFATAFLKTSQSGSIARSVSVLRGKEFVSYQLGGHVYHVGNLPWWVRLRLWFMRYPWLVVVFLVLLCFVLASWSRMWLRHRARVRLQAHALSPR
jgi:cellulose synthase (UDP-forming)